MQQADGMIHGRESEFNLEELFDFKCVYMTVHDAVVHASNKMKFEAVVNTTYL